MPRSRKAPLSSYSPLLLQVWRDALTKTINIPVDTYAQGVSLRQRLYSLRAAMKEEHHADYPGASRISLFIREDSNKKWHLVAEHADGAFNKLLGEAGIDDPSLDPPNLDELLNLTKKDPS